MNSGVSKGGAREDRWSRGRGGTYCQKKISAQVKHQGGMVLGGTVRGSPVVENSADPTTNQKN